MYYILAQFLETKNGKNITTVLEELTNEIKELKEILLKSSNENKSENNS
jgi:hypothetical protein